ncbi:lipid-A-disaccharide synthase N-terminal domain-containing protein [Neotabrizicola shimadae]|uniref:Lipid-A-disaccharide synthase N-terminal domain-containing protein n=1 Tax=Neotabrizicola shimadae TaxID=2807096 RepID=A0A8G0ZUB2_9RHOB|nr:lipid-A-disaccharide synthase N-terminal domain-containing protein [Neotabrizicola shimadae]QYZ68775.1 lipid-A-disaccharide synthase N-terminal domain-containing protein [Neotabrizicola shimadae]
MNIATVMSWFHVNTTAELLWVLFGFAAQMMFTGRFLLQWLASEKQRKSVVPVAFWYFSLAGGVMLLMYAIHRRDPVIILGQAVGVMIYLRNLMLIYADRRRQPT